MRACGLAAARRWGGGNGPPSPHPPALRVRQRRGAGSRGIPGSGGAGSSAGADALDAYLGLPKRVVGGRKQQQQLQGSPAPGPASPSEAPKVEGNTDDLVARRFRDRFHLRMLPERDVFPNIYKMMMAEWADATAAGAAGVKSYEQFLQLHAQQGKYSVVLKTFKELQAAERLRGDRAPDGGMVPGGRTDGKLPMDKRGRVLPKPSTALPPITFRMCLLLMAATVCADHVAERDGLPAARRFLKNRGHELELRHYVYLFHVYAQRMRLWRRSGGDAGRKKLSGRMGTALLSLMVEEDHIRPNAFCWEVVIRTRDSIGRARQIFEQMVATGIPPTLRTFSAQLGVCAYLADVEAAEAVVIALHREGLRPNVYFNTLLLQTYRADDSHDSRRKISIMWQHLVERARAADAGDADDRRVIDAALASIVVAACNHSNPTSGDVARAREVVLYCLRSGVADANLIEAFIKLAVKLQSVGELRWLAGRCHAHKARSRTLEVLREQTQQFTVWSGPPPQGLFDAAGEERQLASATRKIDALDALDALDGAAAAAAAPAPRLAPPSPSSGVKDFDTATAAALSRSPPPRAPVAPPQARPVPAAVPTPDAAGGRGPPRPTWL